MTSGRRLLWRRLLASPQMAFVRLEQDIVGFVKAGQSVRRQLIDRARQTGALVQCPICCDDELIDDDLMTCVNGHAVCRLCIARLAPTYLTTYYTTYYTT